MTIFGPNPVLGQGPSIHQPQGWCYDGWFGTTNGSDFSSGGSVRTLRPGLITIYNVVGTSQQSPGSKPSVIYDYLGTPYEWVALWSFLGLDPMHFEWVNVSYPAAIFRMDQSVKICVTELANLINANPGYFCLTGDSQGGVACSEIYDLLRFGALKSRQSDFLGAFMLGNLRREKGRTFPGYSDPAPGTSGMCVNALPIGPYKPGDPYNPAGGNLIGTEDKWWEACVPGDYFACCPTGNTVVPPVGALGGNIGDTGGVSALWMRIVIDFIFHNYTGDVRAVLGDLLNVGDMVGKVLAAYHQIMALGGVDSPHNHYAFATPFAAKGDTRSFTQIGVDYLNSFANKITPPAPVVHQWPGPLNSVQPGQKIQAGAYAMWTNVHCTGPAFKVGVNAYDSLGGLITTLEAPQATGVSPAPSSGWKWTTLVAPFEMPPNTAKAGLVFDVVPAAMDTGIVWFSGPTFA